MTRKTIGFDVDGVLYWWHKAVYEYSVHSGWYSGTYEEFWTGDSWKLFGKGEPYMGFPTVSWYNICTNLLMLDRPEMVNIKGTKVLRELAKEHNVIYITARNQEIEGITKRMLEEHFPNPEQVTFASDKTIPVLLQNVDLFIEDNVSNCIALKPHTKVLVMKHVWNKQLWRKEFDTIDNLREVEKYL